MSDYADSDLKAQLRLMGLTEDADSHPDTASYEKLAQKAIGLSRLARNASEGAHDGRVVNAHHRAHDAHMDAAEAHDVALKKHVQIHADITRRGKDGGPRHTPPTSLTDHDEAQREHERMQKYHGDRADQQDNG